MHATVTTLTTLSSPRTVSAFSPINANSAIPPRHHHHHHHHRHRHHNHTCYTPERDLQVGLEVFRTRLGDRVDGGDEQRAVGATRADGVDVRSDVTVAAERMRVVGRDAAAGPKPPVDGASNENHLIRRGVAVQMHPFRRAVLFCWRHTTAGDSE